MRHLMGSSSLLAAGTGFILAACGGPPGSGGAAMRITAADGLPLAATHYEASRPGPGILLLHQCNLDRTSWDGLARRLQAAGNHVLAFDYRGYGQTAGERWVWEGSLDLATRWWWEHWGPDVEAAYLTLRGLPGVDTTALVVAGASCGVYLAARLASRRPAGLRAAVLLSGTVNREPAIEAWLGAADAVPVLVLTARDDIIPEDEVESVAQASAAAGTVYVTVGGGAHGTDLFGAHPILLDAVAGWIAVVATGAGP